MTLQLYTLHLAFFLPSGVEITEKYCQTGDLRFLLEAAIRALEILKSESVQPSPFPKKKNIYTYHHLLQVGQVFFLVSIASIADDSRKIS